MSAQRKRPRSPYTSSGVRRSRDTPGQPTDNDLLASPPTDRHAAMTPNHDGSDSASPRDKEVLDPKPTTLTFTDIETLTPPPPRVSAALELENMMVWSDVKKLSDDAATKQYVDAWLEDYNNTRKTQEKQQLEWSDTVRRTYVSTFLDYAALLEHNDVSLRTAALIFFQTKLPELLTLKKDRTLAQELEKDAKPVLRGQFSVTTSEDVASHLNKRVPRVDPPKDIYLIMFALNVDIASLVGGASGSGKTFTAIQVATKWKEDSAVKGGCVMYFPVVLEKDHPRPAKKLSKGSPTHDSLMNATLGDGFTNQLEHQGWDGLLIMMEILDKKIQRTKGKATTDVTQLYKRRRAVFVKYVERIARECTPHYEKLKITAEPLRVALVLDEVGDKPYFVRAACSFFGASNPTLRKKLGLSVAVELAIVLCGTGVGVAGCHGGSLANSYAVHMLTPTSAEALWTRLRTKYPELEAAHRVSPTCRAMGSSNARMAMLLLERVTERKRTGYQQPLDVRYANVLETAESIARDAAMRFKELNGFADVEPDLMLELYGQALNACVWHKKPKEHLKHPELLTKYGAVTDLRSIVGDRLVAANGSETEGRCFTMAPAMMAFFRIMLSYNCVVPVDVTGESFEHAILHFVCAALRSCAGRSVRDFLSLIVTDASTIPNGNTTLTIPSDINKTLLVLSLGHRKFDQKRLKRVMDATKGATKGKEARATKKVVDLAFTVDAKVTPCTLNAKWPVVLLNGSKANAADIIVIVPEVVVCHVQCKDYLNDQNLTVKADGLEKFVEEYRKMTQPLYLAPSPQYYVMATTSADMKLENAIGEIEDEDLALLVMRVPRISNSARHVGNCAYLQSLVALCKADRKTGMIVQTHPEVNGEKRSAPHREPSTLESLGSTSVEKVVERKHR